MGYKDTEKEIGMAYFDTKKNRVAKAVDKATPKVKGQVKKQTVLVNGKRAVITRRMNAAGEVVVKFEQAVPLESTLQAAQVIAMRAHPEYEKRFTFAADMNAGSRGPKAMSEAVATGMVAGEPDIRLSFKGGQTVFVENKAGKGKTSDEQDARHEILRRFGYEVHVINAYSEAEAVERIMAVINARLALMEDGL